MGAVMSVSAMLSQVAGVTGALGIGSVFGQYVASSKDRQGARAGVLSALGDAEATRWLLPGDAGWDDFPADVRKLQTAALIARFPRDAVLEYSVLAQAARWVVEENLERSGGDRENVGIDSYLSEAKGEATRVIAAIAWSQRLTHSWRWRLAKRRIERSLTQLQTPETKEAVERARRVTII